MALDDPAKPLILGTGYGNLKPAKPGQVLNPWGSAGKDPSKGVAYRRKAAKYFPEALSTLVEIMRNDEAKDADRIKAALGVCSLGVAPPPKEVDMTIRTQDLTREQAEDVILGLIEKARARRLEAEQQRALASASGDGQVVNAEPVKEPRDE